MRDHGPRSSGSDGHGGGQGDDEAGALVGSAGSHHRRAPIDSPRRLAAYSPIPEPRAVWVSRRAYGSKIRSRHSSGMPGPSSVTPSWTTPSTSDQSIVMVVSGGAYLTAFSTRCSTIWRSRGGSARAWSRTLGRTSSRWLAEDRAGATSSDLVDERLDVDRRDRRPGPPARPGPRPGSSRRGGRAARSARASRRATPPRVSRRSMSRDSRPRAAARRRAGRCRRGRPRAASAARG